MKFAEANRLFSEATAKHLDDVRAKMAERLEECTTDTTTKPRRSDDFSAWVEKPRKRKR